MRDDELYPCDIPAALGANVSDNKLDKPSQIQFAEAITANIPEADKSLLQGALAAAIAYKVHKSGTKKR